MMWSFILMLDESKLRLVNFGMWRSKSGRGWHILMKLNRPLPIMDRIALQAILGSDSVRELCNYRRAKHGDPYPIVFFEPR